MSEPTSPTHPQPSPPNGLARPQKRVVALCATTLLLALLRTAAAHSETPITTQARADSGTWLPYAPPPPARAGLCLVDTGVNLNPDTETTVIDRTAIDGGTGNDASPETHGTLMAMMAAAPANSWGMIGTAPNAIQIISVRILQPGETTFPFTAYAAGITACLRTRTQDNIRVINLSLGSPSNPTSQELAATTNAIQEANDYGIAVVAAAGNDNSAPLEYPAADPTVLSVGATDTATGTFCSFSNRGEGLKMTAPGCDLDGSDPAGGAPDYNYWQGTSEASVIDASALAALTAYRPDLSYQAAEEDLTSAHAGELDIAGAFNLAGLSATVAAGEAAEPYEEPPSPQDPATTIHPNVMPPSSPMSQPTTTPIAPARSLPRPHARLTRAGRWLLLTLTGRPATAQTQVRLLGHPPHSHRLRLLRLLTSQLNTMTIPRRSVTALTVRYIDPNDTTRNSAPITLHPPADAQHPAGKLP